MSIEPTETSMMRIEPTAKPLVIFHGTLIYRAHPFKLAMHRAPARRIAPTISCQRRSLRVRIKNGDILTNDETDTKMEMAIIAKQKKGSNLQSFIVYSNVLY